MSSQSEEEEEEDEKDEDENEEFASADEAATASVAQAFQAASILFPAPSATDVRVFIKSWAHVAELYIVNRAYQRVAEGVGALSATLPPGRYWARQRLGTSEEVEQFEVPEGVDSHQVDLAMVNLLSPVPLPLISLHVQRSGFDYPFETGEGNFRLMLWATPSSDNESMDRLKGEIANLRIESLDGSLVRSLADAKNLDVPEPTLSIGVHLPVGHYVLIQASGSVQKCMPILLLDGRITAVFLFAADDLGEPAPVQLRHAAVVVQRNGEQVDGNSILRLEAARGALAAGHKMFGWSATTPGKGLSSQSENVLLTLIDTQLARRCLGRDIAVTEQVFEWCLPEEQPRASAPTDVTVPNEQDENEVQGGTLCERLDSIASIMGQQCLDLLALQFSFNLATEKRFDAAVAPPLLRRGWDQLLRSDEGNRLIGELLPFRYQIEPSSSWLVWSEVPGERAQALRRARGTKQVNRDRQLSTRRKVGFQSPFFWNLIDVLRESIPYLSRHDGSYSQETPAPTHITATMSDAVTMLTALLRNEQFLQWLDSARTALERDSRAIRDESIRRLISSLLEVVDPTIVDSLGAEVVSKEILSALRLPQTQVVQVTRDFVSEVLAQQSVSDRVRLLEALTAAVREPVFRLI